MKKLPIEYVESRKNYVLFKNDCGVSDVVRSGNVYESYIFDYLKSFELSGTTIIDVGANLGNHALEFAGVVGDAGIVHAFEAQRMIYYQLCANIILNGYFNVYAHNKAVGERIQNTSVEVPDFFSPDTINVGNTHVGTKTAREEVVPMITLDDFFGIHTYSGVVAIQPITNKISVLKIDAEGYEPFILDGAKQLIAMHKPILFVEVWDVNLGVYKFKEQDVFDRLYALGYTWKKLLDVAHCIDYVAVPK